MAAGWVIDRRHCDKSRLGMYRSTETSRACRCRGTRNAAVADPWPALTDSSSSSSSLVCDLGLISRSHYAPGGIYNR